MWVPWRRCSGGGCCTPGTIDRTPPISWLSARSRCRCAWWPACWRCGWDCRSSCLRQVGMCGPPAVAARSGLVAALVRLQPAPWHPALDLDLQGEAQERPDQHDDAEDEDVPERGRDRYGPDQVGGDQHFQS